MRNLTKTQTKMEKKSNDVTSFFYYMWNRWSEKECQTVWKGENWQHFWDKWCGICKAYGSHGAAERFYAELSDNNRDKLVARAVEFYDGMNEKH